MTIPEKSKPTEMQRLRAAGFSLAKAERLARDRNGPSLFLVICLLVGLFLLDGILVLVVSRIQLTEMPVPLQTASLMLPLVEMTR